MVDYHDSVNPPDPDKLMSPQQVARFYTEVVHEPMSINTARKKMDDGWFEDRGISVEAWGRSLRVVRDDLYRYLLQHHTGAMTRVAMACRDRGMNGSRIIGESVLDQGAGDDELLDRMNAAVKAAKETLTKKGPPPPK